MRQFDVKGTLDKHLSRMTPLHFSKSLLGIYRAKIGELLLQRMQKCLKE